MALQVELVSPERILYSGEAEMVVCRTVGGGEIAFLTGHAPFLAALEIGVVRVKLTDGGEMSAAVHGGFVEVRDNRVIILSDVAELPDQIDVERARKALSEVDSGPTPGRGSSDDGTAAEEAAAEAADARRRAETRLKVAGAA